LRCTIWIEGAAADVAFRLFLVHVPSYNTTAPNTQPRRSQRQPQAPDGSLAPPRRRRPRGMRVRDGCNRTARRYEAVHVHHRMQCKCLGFTKEPDDVPKLIIIINPFHDISSLGPAASSPFRRGPPALCLRLTRLLRARSKCFRASPSPRLPSLLLLSHVLLLRQK
jgi:hypothetical protein